MLQRDSNLCQIGEEWIPTYNYTFLFYDESTHNTTILDDCRHITEVYNV